MRVVGFISKHASFVSEQRVQFVITDEENVDYTEYETPQVVDVSVEQPNDFIFVL
jgi:hypothetical protein